MLVCYKNALCVTCSNTCYVLIFQKTEHGFVRLTKSINLFENKIAENFFEIYLIKKMINGGSKYTKNLHSLNIKTMLLMFFDIFVRKTLKYLKILRIFGRFRALWDMCYCLCYLA